MEDADIRRLSQGMDGRGLAAARVWRNGAIAIVHRQTQITREDRGERQPLAGASGNILAADVRLNDRRELVRALGLPADGVQQADTALLLQALERWGVETALKRLQGDFGFALWNPENQSLILARDYRGSRSLMVHRGPEMIAFATRLRPLLALPGMPRELDEITLAHFLIMHNARPARTFYRAIDRVPPAGFMTLTAGHTQESIYWTEPVQGSIRPRSDKAVEEQAQAVLDVSVADALRAGGPVTAFLTGGLDTSNVVATALRLVAPGRLASVTRAVDGPYPPDNSHSFYEEARRAREFAAMHPGLDWRAAEDHRGTSANVPPSRMGWFPDLVSFSWTCVSSLLGRWRPKSAPPFPNLLKAPSSPLSFSGRLKSTHDFFGYRQFSAFLARPYPARRGRNPFAHCRIDGDNTVC